MRIFIFEGIATSGKSTVINQLVATLANQHVIVVEEDETHIPIMKDTADNHANFFFNLIQQKVRSSADLVIFDRLYLTQAFRSKNNINMYQKVEELLLTHNPITIFLQVREDAIAKRIQTASEHREAYWKDYIQTKGQTIEQIAQYYAEQQESQLQLLKTSAIPYEVFDTTTQNYHPITNMLKELV